jgi:putative SOS response-associated peptidase YedK
MCRHKSLAEKHKDLMDYYSASFAKITEADEIMRWHEHANDYLPKPIVTAGKPGLLQEFNWGLIPHWVKTLPEAFEIRASTLNARSEEMWSKSSFRDALKNGQRCLIPCNGYFETRWMDSEGKLKIPYYIYLRDQRLFSLAGLYSWWKNPQTGDFICTYTVLTTEANRMVSEIHNTGKRMPVIVPRDREKDWLNRSLGKDDVDSFCMPFDENKMDAHPVSKLVNARNANRNIPDVRAPHFWPELDPNRPQFKDSLF